MLASARVHAGFSEAYISVRADVMTIVRERLKLCAAQGLKAQVYVTGHSLGGAVACLCALDLVTLESPETMAPGSTSPTLAKPWAPPATVYNFGSPKLGNAAFKEVYDALVPLTLRLTTPCDLITTVPVGSQYRHVGEEVWLDDAGSQTFAMSWAMHEILPDRNSLSHHGLVEYYGRLNKAFSQRFDGRDYASSWAHLPRLRVAFSREVA